MQILTPEGLLESASVDPGDLQPLVLIGIDAHPRKVASSIGPGTEQVPIIEGWLLGVEAVWAARISRAGTLSTTLLSNPDAGIAAWTVWLHPDQLEKIQEGMVDHTLMQLDGCRWSSKSGDRVIVNPWALVLMHGALLVDGAPRAVAAIRATGGKAQSSMLAEVLIWLSDYALENGFPFTAPKDIVETACSSLQGHHAVNQMLLQLAGPAGLQPS